MMKKRDLCTCPVVKITVVVKFTSTRLGISARELHKDANNMQANPNSKILCQLSSMTKLVLRLTW